MADKKNIWKTLKENGRFVDSGRGAVSLMLAFLIVVVVMAVGLVVKRA